MAVGRRKARERREPAFDPAPAPVLDLKLDARVRPAAPPADEGIKSRRRTPVARDGRKAANDDARPKGRTTAAGNTARPRKKGGSGGGRKQRSFLGWLIYW